MVSPKRVWQVLLNLECDNEYYKISKFGHSLVNRPAGAQADILAHPIICSGWIDGGLALSWSDFQWGQTNFADLWQFESPLVVEQQIVFRIINQCGAEIGTSNTPDGNNVDNLFSLVGLNNTTVTSTPLHKPLRLSKFEATLSS